MHFKHWLAFFFSLLYFHLFGQGTIKGHVLDSLNHPIQGVNIVMFSPANNEILSFASTNEAGYFELRSNTKDPVRLEFSAIGFSKKELAVTPINSIITVNMEQSAAALPEVIVKQKPDPLSRKKDTINYNVDAFSDSSDRAIIDVIKKLPGISVSPSGQILFNNVAINKFYIEGKDLLENRYSIATNNLPSNDVQTIQVLPDHQPIKVLEGSVTSDRAAINIKLKKNAKVRLIAFGNIGIGLPNNLRDDELSLLKFNKDFQMIGSTKSNNIGISFDEELNDQITSPSTFENYNGKQDLVSIVKPATPAIADQRYLFNNNNLFDDNFLVELNTTFTLKVNAAFETDLISQNQSTYTRIYLPGKDTIHLNENNRGQYRYSKLLFGTTLEANTKKLYFNDAIKSEWTSSNEDDEITSLGIDQNLKNPYAIISNNLKAIFKLNSGSMTLTSNTLYRNLPQSLFVTPGQYVDSLNHGQPFDGLLQNAKQYTFHSNNSITYTKSIGNFEVGISSGLNAGYETTNYRLLKDSNKNLVPLVGSFQNMIRRVKYSAFGNLIASYIKGPANISFHLNNSLNYLSDNNDFMEQKNTKFFLNPELAFGYILSGSLENNFTISMADKLIDNTNAAYILYDYRDLTNYNVPINQLHTDNISDNLTYKDVVNGVFGNINFMYSHSRGSVMTYDTFNGIYVISNYINKSTPSYHLNLSASISKYFADLKTTVNIKPEFDSYFLQQIINRSLDNIKNNEFKLTSSIFSSFSNALTISDHLDFTVDQSSNQTNQSLNKLSPIFTIHQQFEFKLFLPKDVQFRSNFEQYVQKEGQNSINYFFTDLYLGKKFLKRKLDLSIGCTNIFDVKTYTNFTYLDNELVASTFPLQERLLMGKVNFQF